MTDYFSYQNKLPCAEQVPLASIAQRLGTPCLCIHMPQEMRTMLNSAPENPHRHSRASGGLAGAAAAAFLRLKSHLLLLMVLLLAPVSLAQAAIPTFQAAGTAVEGDGRDATAAWPTHVINDIGLLFIQIPGGDTLDTAPPAPWVQVTNSPQSTGTSPAGTKLWVYWARATAANMASVDLRNASRDNIWAQIITYRGVITAGNPWDVTGGGVKAAASTSVTVTGVTTTVTDTLIVQAVARHTDSAAAALMKEGKHHEYE